MIVVFEFVLKETVDIQTNTRMKPVGKLNKQNAKHSKLVGLQADINPKVCDVDV